MSALLSGLAQVLHLLLVLAAAPVLVGLVRWLSARLQGSAGAPVLQPWRDILRTMQRPPVVGEGTSWLFRAAPAARLAVLAVAAALVPSFTAAMALAPAADLLAVTGLLALARAIAALAAMDSGSAAGGRIASMAMSRGSLAMPALVLVAFVLALASGSTNLAILAGLLHDDAPGLRAAGLPLALALLAGAAADTAPGAAPDASGRHSALGEAADALRLLVWLGLAAVLFLPPGPPAGAAMAGAAMADTALPEVLGGWLLGLLLWTAKMALLAAGVALASVLPVGPARRHDGPWLALAALLVLLGALLLFAGQVWA